MFVGDVGWDTAVLARTALPEPDEKVLAELCADGVGGVAANAAAACARAGIRTTLCSTVGNDLFAPIIRDTLRSEGIAVTLDEGDGPTTRAIILLDHTGEKRLLLYPGSGMYPHHATVTAVDLSEKPWIHTALYDLETGSHLIARCREAGSPWSIDLEPATIPADFDRLANALDGCNTVFVNQRAVSVIGAGAVDRLLAAGVDHVVETLGPAGARVTSGSGSTGYRPPNNAEPVRDTTGAGDALAGWYVAGRVRGLPPGDAVRQGVAAASWSVRTIGTTNSYPTERELISCMTMNGDEL